MFPLKSLLLPSLVWAVASCVARAAEPDLSALAARQIAQGQAQSAIATLEPAVKSGPSNAEHQRLLGDAYLLAARQANLLSKPGWARKSCRAYEQAVETAPDNLAARLSLMSYYQNAPGFLGGSADKARAQADAIKQRNATRGHVAIAMLLIGEKRFADARTELDEALRLTPADYAALYHTGRLAALSGEHIERGIEALRECLTLAPLVGVPGHDAAQWRLGNLLEKQGDKAAARAAYQASLTVNPAFEDAATALKQLN